MKLTDQIRAIYKYGENRTRAYAKEWLFWQWVLHGHFGRPVSLATHHRATVIIPVYREQRLRNIEPLVRALLQCKFIELVVVSNHNPAFSIHQKIALRDARLVLLNQTVRRGCGFGWVVASTIDAAYYISVDDDVLIYPGQIAKLFSKLIACPDVPHGLAGSLHGEYCERQDSEVDELYQIYAITGQHLKTYMDYVQRITVGEFASSETIEFWADDVIISRAGSGQPWIHDAGRLTRCRTASADGVAIHREDVFSRKRGEVQLALKGIGAGPF
ncbi:MAG: glycosyltransferase family 2 protein [Chloroflexi bacterium]|nr:glycosyltransferase family 2 protein [Chloroflexota bacterium]